MKCASGKVDITPDLHTQLSGDLGVRRYGEKVLDRLFARIMILENGQQRLCIVSMDLTLATEEPCRKMRNAIAELINTSPASVMIHVVQNHTAPGIGHFMLDESVPVPPEHEWMLGGEKKYTDLVTERVIAAVPDIFRRLEESEMISGRAIEGRYSFNRRAIDCHNRIFMPGPEWNDGRENRLRDVEGPIDPEVGVIAFRNKSGFFTGMILSHACHPVCVYPAKLISGDWPGAWSDAMEKNMPENSAALVLNGCCGNLNPWSIFDPDFRCDHLRMGNALAEASRRALSCGKIAEDPDLTVAEKVLPLDFRMPETAELGDGPAYYAQHPAPDWEIPGDKVKLEWFLAANHAGTLEEIKRRKRLDYGIQVFRIGPTAVIGLPGEPFVEGQLALKLAFPESLIMAAHCVNQYVGYIPVRKAFEHPAGFRGHEAGFFSWSKLERGALQKIISTARTMTAETGLNEDKNYFHNL